MSSPKAKDTAYPPKQADVDQQLSGLSGAARPAFAAAFVKALGGPTGDVVQDVTCSFQRQLGRLYVSTDGIFFYSNLFGFERKIRINYEQILVVTKTRTTSLLVKTVDGEEYIFRSFDDRELLLEIILRYHPNAEPENYCGVTPTLDDKNKREACDKSLDDTDNEITHGGESSGLKSCIDIQANISHNNFGEENDHIMDTTRIPIGDGLTENDADAQWAKLLQCTNEWEAAVVNLNLACKSVPDFFESFLRDDAANSLDVYLSDFGDCNIIMKKWQNDIAPGGTKSILRTVYYEHKSGLTMAKVTRQQTYHSFGDNRSCLKNVTSVAGIKGVPSDTFFLEDTWFIESAEVGVTLNVKFHVNFTKPTMLRSIIKKRATTEAREWYMQYTTFVRQRMHPSGTQDDAVLPPSTSKANTNAVQILTSIGRLLVSELSDFYRHAPVVLFVCLSFIIYQLQFRVSVLERNVKELELRLYESEMML